MQVDFYLLDEQTNLISFACGLIEKIYQASKPLFIHASDEQQALALDEALWTFRDNSFVPHNLLGEGPKVPPPVQIGFGDVRPQQRNILLLAAKVPEYCHKAQHIIELVPAKDSDREISREHFKLYRKLGATIQTHKS